MPFKPRGIVFMVMSWADIIAYNLYSKYKNTAEITK